ncbi:A/G-specific adenine glycosylase [Actinomadura barringtoniae]|uniref:Adenine DNA glycosylase n=1 Tax=Actinomadura barringtoniae TaxID=1427535 RepID=A0A939PES5_9ACTN|nr:A/G-specific adenine glycosylase [Actinomadura barringtoniae]MBO2451512.1 A/G-specific adenine glycosylase [Actinomadura barringtoniae]
MSTAYTDPILAWYESNARDLPWRSPSATPWGVLVSEIMLQQTPVNRVMPVWHEWMKRWPTPPDLAAEPSGEAVRAWGRLGYPRRALRLHATAKAITERHDGEVPSSHAELLDLPGIGSYTAAAVASFAYRQRHAVLDTNVRRVLSRLISGDEYPPKSQTKAEVATAEALLPLDPPTAALWSVAVMELGALVCTARTPRCVDCPVLDKCTWQLEGRPAYDGPPRRGQTYAGTDRQCRGRLMAVLRDAEGPVEKPALDIVWSDPIQRERALDTLIADGLVDPLDDGRYALPS